MLGVGNRDIADLLCSTQPSNITIQCNEQKADAPIQKTRRWQGNHSTAWHWIRCHAGDNRGFGIPENLLLLSSLPADRQTENSIHLCVSNTLLRAMTSYWTPWLAMRGGGHHKLSPELLSHSICEQYLLQPLLFSICMFPLQKVWKSEVVCAVPIRCYHASKGGLRVDRNIGHGHHSKSLSCVPLFFILISKHYRIWSHLIHKRNY